MDKENFVSSFANENMKLENIEKYNTLEEALNKNDMIVTGVPISKDKKYIVANYTNLKIKLDFLQNLKNKILISGMIPDKYEKILKENKNYVVDLLKNEDYIIFNAKITVEGIIKYLIENTKTSLFNSKILVLGYGRIGKILCNVLKSFTENIYCVTYSKEETEIARANTINVILEEDLEKFLKNFEIIINTVPKIILDSKKLNMLYKEAFVLDVASKPGGIDQDFAQKNKINYMWKLGIPSEISPIECAKKIQNEIYKNNITYILQWYYIYIKI